MKKKRKIIYITGTRADYGLMRTVLKAIDKNSNLELRLIVCGMHLLPEFGDTLKEIKKDKFKIAATIKSPSLGKNDGIAMARLLGETIIEMTKVFKRMKPDMILLEADRGEMLAGAIAAAHMNILIAHISGGDVSGTIDDSIRHSITKFAHLHFPGTTMSCKRIVQMGEDPHQVFMVGTPGLEFIKNKFNKNLIRKKFNINPDKPFLLVIQHSVTNEVREAGKQIKETMEALVRFGEPAIIIYPNADAGGREVISVIKKYDRYPFLRIFRNISRDSFLELLSIADVIVGNSSCAIVEAPSFNLPAVNIGTRQKGRERAGNVIDVGYSRHEILRGLKKAIFDKDLRRNAKLQFNPYKNVKTGLKIANILSTIRISSELFQKEFYE